MKPIDRPYTLLFALVASGMLMPLVPACDGGSASTPKPTTQTQAQAQAQNQNQTELKLKPELEAKADETRAGAAGATRTNETPPKVAPPKSTGTPLHVEDQPTLSLETRVVQERGKPALQLSYQGQPLAEHRHAIEHQMNDLAEYDIQIPDFEHDGKRYRVSVMAVQPDGSLEPWECGDKGCVSPKITRPERETVHVPFVVVAVREDGKQVLSDPYPETITPPMNPPPPAPPHRTTTSQGTGDDSAADDTTGG